MYSNNGSTFKAAAQWLQKALRDAKFNRHLTEHSDQVQFNLSHAPWRRGQFERLIGVFMMEHYKTIDNWTIQSPEFKEVVSDVTLTNPPLNYLRYDIQFPVTLNFMLDVNLTERSKVQAQPYP